MTNQPPPKSSALQVAPECEKAKAEVQRAYRRIIEQQLDKVDAVKQMLFEESDSYTLLPTLTTSASPAPMPPHQDCDPAPLINLSKEQWGTLLESGQTMTIGSINVTLAVLEIKAATLATLKIPTHKERSATHMPAAHFPDLCDRLVECITRAKQQHLQQ